MKIAPQPGPQTHFLTASADVVIYGGQAGGGKTFGLLIDPLRYIGVNGFGAIIFRNTYKQIAEQGGLWDESEKIYPHAGGEIEWRYRKWVFPAGAEIRFSYLWREEDKYTYDGAQIPYLGFDQLEQFSESQFFYMLSRNRSVCAAPPCVRATCNPKADSWLATFLAWWIDQDTGYADMSKSGATRYMLRVNEEIKWANTEQELITQYNATLDGMLKAAHAQSIDIKPTDLIHSVTFIPASVYDNRILLEQNPGYLARLLSLPKIERERLLLGNWHIMEEAGNVFNRAWFRTEPAPPAGGILCRFWDFAATEKKLRSDNPDYTAGVLIRYKDGLWYIEDVYAKQASITAADRAFRSLTEQDAAKATRENIPYLARWEQEPGSAGKKETARLARMLSGVTRDVKGIPSSGSKLERAKGLASQAEAGNVILISADWNERFLNHMHNQPDAPHDDIMDASSGAYNAIIDKVHGKKKTAGLGW